MGVDAWNAETAYYCYFNRDLYVGFIIMWEISIWQEINSYLLSPAMRRNINRRRAGRHAPALSGFWYLSIRFVIDQPENHLRCLNHICPTVHTAFLDIPVGSFLRQVIPVHQKIFGVADLIFFLLASFFGFLFPPGSSLHLGKNHFHRVYQIIYLQWGSKCHYIAFRRTHCILRSDQQQFVELWQTLLQLRIIHIRQFVTADDQSLLFIIGLP